MKETRLAAESKDLDYSQRRRVASRQCKHRDSLGFLAIAGLKRFCARGSAESTKSLQFYDHGVLPFSRLLDQLGFQLVRRRNAHLCAIAEKSSFRDTILFEIRNDQGHAAAKGTRLN